MSQWVRKKYILYADLSDMDIGTADSKSLNGKRVGVLLGTEPEIMLTECGNLPTPELLEQTRHELGLDQPFWYSMALG